MTNREFIRKLLEAPGDERDFEFIFTAGYNHSHENEYNVVHPDEVTPDWPQWLDQEVDPNDLIEFRRRTRKTDIPSPTAGL